MIEAAQPSGERDPAWRERLAVRVLECLADGADSGTVARIVRAVADETGLQGAAVRIRQGDDYPFYATHGYTDEFVRLESSLRAHDPVDHPGDKRLLVCLCGAALENVRAHAPDYHTGHGSLVVRRPSDLQRVDTSKVFAFRGRCISQGFQTLALIPLRHAGEVIGLMHLSDRRPEMLDDDDVAFLERLGASVGAALAHHLAAETVRKEAERTRVLLQLHERAPHMGDRELYRFIIDQVVRLTDSTIGFLHLVSSDGKAIILTAWNEDALAMCTASQDAHYPIEQAGAWVDCLRARAPVVYNDGVPHRTTMPEGHVSVDRFMSIPVYDGERPMLIFGVGNKAAPYDDGDKQRLQLVANEVAKIVQQRSLAADHARLEDELRQAQKLEAIGQLAGGVAHDFNNVLAAILVNTGLLLEDIGTQDPLRESVVEIDQAAARAASLTRQLLAFSRRQVLSPEPHDLNEIVRGLLKMLGRVIGEHVAIRFDADPDLGLAMVDRSQIEQVIVNLAVNARDAMPLGGTLTIRTENATGARVALIVSDDGLGMDDKTRLHIFEPFFTTKQQGKGTGLGLATVFGIVKQSNGDIAVESAPNEGTTFTILLPRVADGARRPRRGGRSSRAQGNETILIVEDEDVVRTATRKVLLAAGYTVLSAASGPEALDLVRARSEPIDLALVDVIMPHMTGRQLATELGALRPSMKVLFMSGYTNDLIASQGVLDPGTSFLQKPFRPNELTEKVREVLDAAPLVRA